MDWSVFGPGLITFVGVLVAFWLQRRWNERTEKRDVYSAFVASLQHANFVGSMLHSADGENEGEDEDEDAMWDRRELGDVVTALFTALAQVKLLGSASVVRAADLVVGAQHVRDASTNIEDRERRNDLVMGTTGLLIGAARWDLSSPARKVTRTLFHRRGVDVRYIRKGLSYYEDRLTEEREAPDLDAGP